jgi:hypothetical protein
LKASAHPVVALYVEPGGPYPALLGAERCWDKDRDARGYAGPSPVVAHPPCGPWGRFAWASRYQDPGLGILAVEQVRRWGGVLEHPAHSKLWTACGLWRPGEWTDPHGGFSLQVEQVRWGHSCIKSTWLYIVGLDRREVGPMPPPASPTHVVAVSRATIGPRLPSLGKEARRRTPEPFARWLVSLAQRCRPA